MRALLNLRYTTDERARMFRAGLESLGYTVLLGQSGTPEPGDLFITWNRIGHADHTANQFVSAGARVLVVENASWGNEFAGDNWYHIAENYHNTAGCFPVGDSARWDSIGVELQPWRTKGETVILMQRGIGKHGSPVGWSNGIDVRRRPHPGRNKSSMPLDQDLAHAGKVVTWGSGAAIKALMMGIPVESKMPNWIGQQDNTDEGRLAMFRKLAWAQWRHGEIESGEAFRWVMTGI